MQTAQHSESSSVIYSPFRVAMNYSVFGRPLLFRPLRGRSSAATIGSGITRRARRSASLRMRLLVLSSVCSSS